MRPIRIATSCLVGLGLICGCDINPPVVEDPLSVEVGQDQFTTEEETLTLRATASGGDPPYRFRWNIELVPDDPDNFFDGQILPIPDNTKAEIDTLRFQVGQYIYRVMVTDATGNTSVDFVSIEVGPTPLRVTISQQPEDEDEPLMVVAAEAFTLSAEANMDGDFTFKWAAFGDVEVEFVDDSLATTTAFLLEPGEAIIQVTITEEEEGDAASALITVVAEQGDAFLVDVERPDLLIIDEPGTFTAEITNDTIDQSLLSYQWEVVGDADIEITSPTSKTTEIISRVLQTIELSVTVSGTINDTDREATEEIAAVVLPDLRPQFDMFVTSTNEGVIGMISFEFFADDAPKTVANLVRYIDEGFYTSVLWHRMATNVDGTPFVAQAGGFKRGEEELERFEPTHDPVENESDNGLSNLPGTVAMALTGGAPNSGTTQFFVNLSDNAFLDASQFTVFGEVVAGMDIIDAMALVETDDEHVLDDGTLSDVPVEDITIISFRRTLGARQDDDKSGDTDDEGTTEDPPADEEAAEHQEPGSDGDDASSTEETSTG